MGDWLLGPGEILQAFAVELRSGELWSHIKASLARSIPGFLLGSLLGGVLGLAGGISRTLDEILSTPVFVSYPVPKIVFLPIAMVWFGIGDLSKIIIIAAACFYPMYINAYYGARATRTILVWSALNMGARPAQLFWKVVVPSAAPMMLTGLRVALALSFVLLFAAEMAGSRSGLGWLIKQAEQGLRFDLMYVSILTIALLGLAGDSLLSLLGRRLLAWADQR
jgi:ABC-type nitrate/sulfonate/bicarbonate transport system permease component